jgi:hypothetical protein
MVGAINPNTNQMLDARIRAARGADVRMTSGETIPKEIASSVLSENPALATSSTSDPSTDRHSPKLSSRVIAGIVLGGIVSLVVCACVFVCVARRRRMKAVKQPIFPLPKKKRCKAISQPRKHKRATEGSISVIQEGSVSYGRTLQT